MLVKPCPILLILMAFCFTLAHHTLVYCSCFISIFLLEHQWEYDKSLQYYFGWEKKEDAVLQIYASNFGM